MSKKQPNIVFIMADQLAAQALSLYGNRGNRRTSGVSYCDGTWYQPDPSGYHHGREHGDRDDHTTGRVEPVRDLGSGGNANDARRTFSTAIPWRTK